MARTWSLAFVLLAVLVTILLSFELLFGSVRLPLDVLIAILTGSEGVEVEWRIIFLEIRLPRAVAAGLGGAALGAAGMLLQTLFRNPLADPWALGITGGAQLGVAVVVVAGSLVGMGGVQRVPMVADLGVVAGAGIGASLVLVVVGWFAPRVGSVTLLIMGLMLGFLAESLVGVILHFTHETQADIYAGWADGSFGGMSLARLPVFVPLIMAGLISCVVLLKTLNAVMLGEEYASSLGLDVARVRRACLATAVLLAAPVTAYCGPIIFLGLIVPHMGRAIFRTSDHRVLFPAVVLLGAAIAVAGDLVVNQPWDRHFLHLNNVNALIGAPLVLWLVARNRQLRNLEA